MIEFTDFLCYTLGNQPDDRLLKGYITMKKSTKIIILIILILMCILMAIGGISMGIAMAG